MTNHTLGSDAATEYPKLMFRSMTEFMDQSRPDETRTRSFLLRVTLVYTYILQASYLFIFLPIELSDEACLAHFLPFLYPFLPLLSPRNGYPSRYS